MLRGVGGRFLVLALLVAAASGGLLVAVPGKAEAQQTGLTVSYNWANGRFDFSWVDDSNYSGTVGTLTRRCQVDESPSAGHWIYYGTAPDPVNTGTGSRISSNCNIRSVVNRSLNVQAGTTYYFDLRTRNQFRSTSNPEWQDDWNDLDTEVTFTVPGLPGGRVAIDSAFYSSATNSISVFWSAPAGFSVPSGTDWWLLGTRDNDVEDTDRTDSLRRPLAVLLAEDSPNTRSATISLSDLATTITVPPSGESTTYLWLVASVDSTNPPDEDDYLNGTSPGFSPSYALDWGLQDCDDSYFQDLGDLSGYSHDITGGDLAAPECRVHYEDSNGTTVVGAETFRFRLPDTRDVTVTLTVPSAFAGTAEGRYKVRIRSQGIGGTIVATEETVQANQLEIELDAFTASSGFDYFLEVMRKGTGGGYDWSMNLAYGFIQPRTPTPAPTPTPRIQPNLDFRLHPNPSGIGYTADETYSFESEGPSHIYPLTVRSANPAALELSIRSSVVCDTTSPDSVRVGTGDALYVRACTPGRNTTLQIIAQGGDLVGEYPVYVRGGPVPTPGTAVISQGIGQDVSKRDLIGLSIVVGVVCGGFGVGCDVDLITNLIVTVVAVGVMAFLLQRSRGAATSMGIGVAAAFAVVALMLGHLWVGFPLWLVGIVLIAILAVGGVAWVVKGRQVA